MSAAKVALGRRLFFEPRLARDRPLQLRELPRSGARLHRRPRGRAVGATGAGSAHNAMALMNVAYNVSFGWTAPARLRSLEAQMRAAAVQHAPGRARTDGPRARTCARSWRRIATMPRRSRPHFPASGRPVSVLDHLIKAIAAFERTLISGHSPFDRYVFGGEHDGAVAGGQARHGAVLLRRASAARAVTPVSISRATGAMRTGATGTAELRR